MVRHALGQKKGDAFLPEMESMALADGKRMAVYALEPEIITDGITKEPKTFGFFFNKSWGTRTEGNGALSISTFNSDDEVVGQQFEAAKGVLLMEANFFNRAQQVMRPNNYLSERMEIIKNSKNSYDKSGDFGGTEKMMAGKGAAGSMPDYLVQIQDADGSWLHGFGPYFSDQIKAKRGVIVFKTWPRSLATLKFRVLQAGLEPVVFEMANPRHESSPKKWPVDTLPKIFSGKDYELEVRSVSQEELPGVGRVLTVESDFRPDPEMMKNSDRAMSSSLSSLRGGFGSFTLSSRTKIDGRYRTIFPMARDEKIFRAIFTVQRNDGYPVAWNTVDPIAEGLLSEDGKSAKMRVTKSGLDSLTCEMKKNTRGDGDLYISTLRGKWSGDSQRTITEKMSNSSSKVGLLFLDKQDLSSGRCHRSGSSSGSSGNSGDFEINYKWSGVLKPGQKIRFALRDPLPPEIMTFTFDEAMLNK